MKIPTLWRAWLQIANCYCHTELMIVVVMMAAVTRSLGFLQRQVELIRLIAGDLVSFEQAAVVL